MLKAEKSVLFEKLFAVYNRNLLKRRFGSFRVKNLHSLKSRDKTHPLIIYANHSSWWDGLVLFEILKSRDFDAYVLMEEKQLKNLRLFRLLGAFSIVRENSRQAFESLKYIIEVLASGENKTLLIFPQGKIFPNDKRPINFYNGLARIIRNLNNCNLIPCSIRYEFLGNFKPEIFVHFGEIQTIDNAEILEKKLFTHSLEQIMTQNLQILKNDINEDNLAEYQYIF